MGAPDVLLLAADLSEVSSPAQARRDFARWKKDIQRDRKLWERGWTIENVRIVIQRWADGNAQAILSLLGLRP